MSLSQAHLLGNPNQTWPGYGHPRSQSVYALLGAVLPEPKNSLLA